MAARACMLILALGASGLACSPAKAGPETAEPASKPGEDSRRAGEREAANDPSDSGDAADEGPALTREEIRVVVRAKLPQVRACFEAGEDPGLRARVQVRFTIGPDGKAQAIELVDADVEAPGRCIAEQLETWQFPRPRGGRSVTIVYPFVYSSAAALAAAGLPRVEGTLDPQAVGAVFEARRAELDACIPDGGGGTIGVALSVDEGGAVTRISSYRDSLPDNAGACVVRTVSSWLFPPAAPGDEARVNHELRW